MTDQSRVEAVARALAAAANWVWDGLADDVKDYWRELAQAAIEANDAWLWNKARKQHWGRDVLGHLDFLLSEQDAGGSSR